MLLVRLLGEQAITDDVTAGVPTRSHRSLALVAYLALHAHAPQPRQRIAGLFWPDSGDAQALTNLRRELHNLRRVLGGDSSLVVSSSHLCWRDTKTCRVDVRTFETEREAALAQSASGDDQAALSHATASLEAYRGSLLPGVYDDWLLDDRERLERECVEMCDLVSEMGARSGDLAGAVGAARRRIQLQPLEEVGYRTLMNLQAELGDRAGAISTYHRCASVLERELGVEPDDSTQTTFQALLRPAPVEHAADPAAAPGRSKVAAAPLTGRTRELEMLESQWDAATHGSPRFVSVSGDAGVGKTRLVTELASLVRSRGAAVGSTQCFGASGRLALAPVADWLRTPEVAAAVAGLDPVWRTEVERLVPSGAAETPVASASRAMVDAWQRHRFFEGLARAITGAGRPLLLVLDNLQWCDPETLSVLGFTLSVAGQAPLMVAATLRRDDPGSEPGLAEWMTHLRDTGRLVEVVLAPLEVEDTARLAQNLRGRPWSSLDADLLQATTGGFPLYVVEAARAISHGGAGLTPPGDLDAVLRRRIAQVTPDAQQTAGLAAAFGKDFSLELLTEASDLPADTVVRAVDELWRHRILRALPRGYDFSHDLLRDTAYEQVSPPQRWLLHRRLAQALELAHADRLDDVASQLAEQYDRGDVPARAVTYYCRAAETAARTFAHGEAIRLYGRARTLVGSLPDGRGSDALELEIIKSASPSINARHGYSSPQLQHAAERCLALSERLGRTNDMLNSLIALWASRFVQGRVADGHGIVTRALGLTRSDSEMSGQVHFAFAGSAVTMGRVAESLRHFDRACAESRGAPSLIVGTRPEVHALGWAAHAHWLQGNERDALSACQEAVAVARRIEHPYSLAVALAYGAITYQINGAVEELKQTVAELGELCARYGFVYYREWGVVLDGWSRTDGSGLAVARRGVDRLRAQGALVRMPYWQALVADLLTREGRTEAASSTLDAAIVDGRAREELWWVPELMRMRASHDPPHERVRRLRAAADLARSHGSRLLVDRCERDLAAQGATPVTPAVRPGADL